MSGLGLPVAGRQSMHDHVRPSTPAARPQHARVDHQRVPTPPGAVFSALFCDAEAQHVRDRPVVCAAVLGTGTSHRGHLDRTNVICSI